MSLAVTAVLGTIDEAPSLRRLLPRLCAVVQEIVIVDDASRDDSRAVARAHGAIVVERSRRLGIGSAVYAGVARASLPVVVTMDADGSHPPEAIRDAYAALVPGVDVVRFSRFVAGAVWEAPRLRRVGVRTLAAVLGPLCRLPLTDPTNGFMLARRDCFAGPTRFRTDPGEGWVAEFLARNRHRSMVELPYVHAARSDGRSRFGFAQEVSRAVRSVRLGIAPAIRRSS